MAENQTPQKSKEEMTCFVVIGFGMKTDFATGRTLNLDLTYTKLIKPAFDKVGIRCFRAIDINVTGSIDKLMYNWIYQADFVIADLSTMNANVFYELGVRHAQKRNTTLLMAEKELFKRLPFDLSHTIIYGYEHLGEDIADEEAERFVGLLSSQVQKLLDNPVDEDSPVYVYMPGMDEPEWTDPKELIAELEAKLAERAAFAAQAGSAEPGEIDPEAVKKQSLSIIVDSAEAAKKRKDFPTAMGLFTAATENDPQDMFLWQRLALVTYKNKEDDSDEEAIAALKEAEQILAVNCDLHISTDPETLGLAGAINKRLYERTDDLEHFEKAVFYYERGFYIKQDYYTGINAAFMYTVKAAEIAEDGHTFEAIVYYGHANLIRKKVADICLKLVNSETFANRGDKEWVYLTLYEAYFGRELYDEAEEYVPFIKKLASDFALDSFEDQKAKLTEIMERFKSKVPMSGGDGADFSAPEAPSQALVPSETSVVPAASTPRQPTVRQAPSEAISIDLGAHRDKPVKSIEITCKVEFE
ncbi:MAG: tetratricopeptide repeat-containing protein [Rhodothermales bacterium]